MAGGGLGGRRLAAAVVAVAAGLLPACGAPEYRYVANREHGNYFKVPAGWSLSDRTQADREGRPAEYPGSVEVVWHARFDSTAGAGEVPTDEGGLPVALLGDARIYTVSNYQREAGSLSSWRARQFAFGEGVDPAYPPQELAERVRLVSYAPLESGGRTGSRVIVNVDLSGEAADEAHWATVDLSTLVDAGSGEVYTLTMWCEASCYLANQRAADTVAASWKVKS
jgi:hypothetical protein